MMNWCLSYRCDPRARVLADRHYNRQSIGAPNFVPPGRCLVLTTPEYDALWVTSWPFAEYVRHAWAGAWICSCFRNESKGYLSSDLILDAVAATRWKYGDPPELGMVTFVNDDKVRSTNPGYCYLKAGWQKVGRTQGGLTALQLPPSEMPEPVAPIHAQRYLNLFTKPEGE